jgi:hypothetical protein
MGDVRLHLLGENLDDIFLIPICNKLSDIVTMVSGILPEDI